MNRFERFVARWLVVRLLRWPHQGRMREFFALMRQEVMSEFPEDNRGSAHDFIRETLEKSYGDGA